MSTERYGRECVGNMRQENLRRKTMWRCLTWRYDPEIKNSVEGFRSRVSGLDVAGKQADELGHVNAELRGGESVNVYSIVLGTEAR